jgi:hypothetical protein
MLYTYIRTCIHKCTSTYTYIYIYIYIYIHTYIHTYISPSAAVAPGQDSLQPTALRVELARNIKRRGRPIARDDGKEEKKGPYLGVLLIPAEHP